MSRWPVGIISSCHIMFVGFLPFSTKRWRGFSGGLKSGDDVTISGVKVGSIANIELDPETYLAKVYMSVDQSVELPLDTAAMISSESIMGGRFLALEPGAEEEMIQPGGRVPYTQAPQNLEQLLGQFIFSMNNDDDN